MAPVLVRVFDLYADGKTNKFDILFSLDEDEEEMLETYTANVRSACWTRAALSAIAEVLVRREAERAAGGDWRAIVEDTLASAKAAYADFPWHLPDLVEQAPDLHAQVLERVSDSGFGGAIPKRLFAKICKATVYGYLKE
ncbi:MAG: hypothetical protein HOH04_00050 [Rhodospirillaceae bacterium]|nr:hypothetical protein [Rhodospirillaceae bacterium]